jgi:conjugative transfer signal peptidase TraF
MIERHDPAQSGPLAADEAAQHRCRAMRWRCAIGAGCLSLLVLTAFLPPAPRLVWNASASAPVGLYAVAPQASLTRGDMVIAWAPRAARMLAARRHYLPVNVPLVKRITAIAGDRVCAGGAVITIEGRRAATRLPRDAARRPMPRWRGCATLKRGQFLLLADAAASFDGRYFGPSSRADIVGRAAAIWTWR